MGVACQGGPGDGGPPRSPCPRRQRAPAPPAPELRRWPSRGGRLPAGATCSRPLPRARERPCKSGLCRERPAEAPRPWRNSCPAWQSSRTRRPRRDHPAARGPLWRRIAWQPPARLRGAVEKRNSLPVQAKLQVSGTQEKRCRVLFRPRAERSFGLERGKLEFLALVVAEGQQLLRFRVIQIGHQRARELNLGLRRPA